MFDLESRSGDMEANSFFLSLSQMTNHRDVFQLHHVYGGLVGCLNHHDSQLPPPTGGHTRNAKLGK